MTERLPRVSAKDVLRVLEQIGFSLSRQSGSHMIYKNADRKRITIPYHSGKTLHPKLLQSILKDANLSIEAFIEILR